jgi:Tol biopolymer transport system component
MTTTNRLRVGQNHDQIVLFVGAKSRVIADARDGDRFYAPMLSPDGRWLSYRGLQKGLFVYRLSDGQKFLLGSGDHARFSEDSRFLLFERSTDDGEKLTSSKIMITDLRDPELNTAQIKTPKGLAQYPSLSVHAQRMAFVLDGKIVIARVKILTK